MTIAGFFANSLYNVIEINVQIFLRFQKRIGLYFWSLLFASWGITPHSVGFLLQYFQLCRKAYVNIVIITLGGVPMVIGQSVVLYSRLHLVVEDKRKIRWGARDDHLKLLSLTVPPTVLNFGSNGKSTAPNAFNLPGYKLWPKLALAKSLLQGS